MGFFLWLLLNLTLRLQGQACTCTRQLLSAFKAPIYGENIDLSKNHTAKAFEGLSSKSGFVVNMDKELYLRQQQIPDMHNSKLSSAQGKYWQRLVSRKCESKAPARRWRRWGSCQSSQLSWLHPKSSTPGYKILSLCAIGYFILVLCDKNQVTLKIKRDKPHPQLI